MNPEKLIYDFYGIRKEHPKTNPFALGLFLGLSNAHALRSRLVVDGYIPAEGPVIFISNHTGIGDVFGMFYAGMHATKNEQGEPTIGRVPRGVGKSTLFGIPELPNIRQRTGKTDLLNSDNPLAKALVRNLIGNLLLGAGVIPIRRGLVDRVALNEINMSLRDYHQTVALSIMESRAKNGRVEGLKPGAAFILKANPNIPFCLVGISKDPNAISISEATTYAEFIREKEDTDPRKLIRQLTMVTMALADGIVELLPPRIQEHWRQEGREAEVRNLTYRKITA